MKRWTARSAGPAAAAPADAVATVDQFLVGLSLLQNIPLNHLVPYAALMPPESIQFFNIDPNWMQALYQGALSMLPLSAQSAVTIPALPGQTGAACFGFLLNSALVSNWPTLTITASTGNVNAPVTVAPLRLEILTPTLLIALYPQVCNTITLTEPHEGLVLGFSSDIDNPTVVDPVFPSGPKMGAPSGANFVTVQPWSQSNGYAQLDLQNLYTNVKSTSNTTMGPGFTNDMWGLELIQHTSSVQILVNPSSAG